MFANDKSMFNWKIFNRSFIFACFIGFLAFVVRIYLDDNFFAAIAILLIIPFTCFYLNNRNFTNSITLVFIGEIVLGIDGKWITFGSIPGRLFVLFIIIVIALNILAKKIIRHKLNNVDLAMVIFGIVIPLFLFSYSTIAFGTYVFDAAADSARFLILLSYYPLRHLLKDELAVALGWISGGAMFLSLMMMFSSIGPQPLASEVYYAYSGTTNISTLDSGISRTVTPIFTLALPLLYFSWFVAIDIHNNFFKRVVGLSVLIVTIAPLILSFMRGPLLAILFVSLLLFTTSFIHGIYNAITARIGLTILVLFTSGILSMQYFVPEGFQRFFLDSRTFYEFLTDDPDRMEQGQRMIDAFLENPLLGKGIGVPLIGYSRGGTDAPLIFELHYHMILYRTGIIITTLFIFMIYKTSVEILTKQNWFCSEIKKFQLGVLCSLITVFISGITNPYLVTSFTIFLFALYWAIRSVSPNNRKK